MIQGPRGPAAGGTNNLAAQRAREAAAERARQQALERARERAAAQRREAQQAQAEAQRAQQKVDRAQTRTHDARGQVDGLERRFDQVGQKLPDKQREKLVGELRDARKQLRTETDSLTQAKKDAGAARDKAITEGNKALKLEREANDVARKAGKKEPFALANQVKDVFDAGSLSTKDQKKLLGTSGIVTEKEAKAFDAAVARASTDRVKRAIDEDPVKGAQALERELAQTKDPGLRQALLEANQGNIETLGKALTVKGQTHSDPGNLEPGQRQDIIDSLSRTADLGGQKGAQLIADNVTKPFSDESKGTATGPYTDAENLVQHFQDNFDSDKPSSPLLASAMAKSLKDKDDKGWAELNNVAVSRIEDEQGDFMSARKKVEDLNKRLNGYLASAGPALTDQERKDFIENFKKEHETEYTEFDKQGDEFARTLESFGTVGESRQLMAPDDQDRLERIKEDIPKIAETPGGQKAITKALEASQKGEPSWLDSVDHMKSSRAFTQKMQAAVVKSVSHKLVEDAKDDPESAKRLLQGLKQNHRLFGVEDPNDPAFGKSLQALEDLSQGKNPEKALKALKENTSTIEGGQGLRTLGVVTNLAGLLKDGKTLSEATLKEKVAFANDVLGTTAEGGTLLLDVVGAKADSLRKVLGGAAKVNAVTSGILGGVDAFDQLAKGHYDRAAIGGVSSGLSIAAAVGLIPGGNAVVIAATAINAGYKVVRDAIDAEKYEAEFKDLLQKSTKLDLDDETLQVLTENGDPDTGVELLAKADELGVPPRELLQGLDRFKTEDGVRDYLDAVKETPNDVLKQLGPGRSPSLYRDISALDSKDREKLFAVSERYLGAEPKQVLDFMDGLNPEQRKRFTEYTRNAGPDLSSVPMSDDFRLADQALLERRNGPEAVIRKADEILADYRKNPSKYDELEISELNAVRHTADLHRRSGGVTTSEDGLTAFDVAAPKSGNGLYNVLLAEGLLPPRSPSSMSPRT